MENNEESCPLEDNYCQRLLDLLALVSFRPTTTCYDCIDHFPIDLTGIVFIH